MSLFANSGTATQNQTGSLFGNSTTSQPQQQPSLFGNTAAATSAPSGGLFGATTSQAPSGGLFGGAATSQPAATGSLFGNAPSQPAQSTSLFGNTASQPAQTTSLFGKPAAQPATTSLFGGSTTANNAQQQNSKSLFAGFGGGAPPPQAQSIGAANPDLNTWMLDSRRIWNEEDGAPRARTVLEQLQMVNKKWDPSQSQHSFQTYLYNQVDPTAAPFYRPSPGENEEAWEDALRKAPSAGSIPFRVRGFYELGMRIVSQQRHLEILSGRLHEINNGLSELLRKHELDITSRSAAARRRHTALSQRVLTLATKTMIARNRGYQLEPAEEQLRRRLADLERSVTDPAISGREEEIWARMVHVREQGRRLEDELQRTGLGQNGEKSQELSEDVVKQAEKVLKDYDQQLSHLTKELEQITKDWQQWEESRPGTNGDLRR